MTHIELVRLITELEELCFSEPWSRAAIESELEKKGCVCIVDDDGFVLGNVLAPEAELLRIAVRDSARRRGIGTELLARFISECSRRGAESVFLEVRADNIGGAGLYGRFGFGVVAVRKKYYGNPVCDGIDRKSVV